jgi:glucosamine--fructose-6-phosphate aminotransferase (isomerizing)
LVAADFSVIEGPYLRDILDQPRALDATLAALACPDELQSLASRLQRGDFRCVALTGMGSSFHALHPTNLELIRHRFLSLMLETSELVHYQNELFDEKTLIVAVSQSGQSVEMLRLLEANAGRSKIIAVTNTARSPLAENASAAILTEAGREFSVSCKTYTTALMSLRWLTAVLCGDNLAKSREEFAFASPAVKAYLDDWQEHTQSMAHQLRGFVRLFLVGRGASLAAVGTGALTIKESDHFPAEGMSSAAFRHGPFEMLSPETFVLAFSGENSTRELNLRLLRDIREQDGKAGLVGEDSNDPACKLSPAPPSVRPILEILPVQMITVALAAQTGREAGRFDFANKVTTVE